MLTLIGVPMELLRPWGISDQSWEAIFGHQKAPGPGMEGSTGSERRCRRSKGVVRERRARRAGGTRGSLEPAVKLGRGRRR